MLSILPAPIYLLNQPILSSSDTEFAQFVQKLQALDWANQGHALFHEHVDDKCPYCQQELPVDFEQQLSMCMDESYKESVRRLEDFANSYLPSSRQLYSFVHASLPNLVPLEFKTDALNDKTQILLSVSTHNGTNLNQKLKEPGTVIEFDDANEVIITLNTVITEVNEKINRHNQLILDRENNKKMFTQMLVAHMASEVSSELASYQKALNEYNQKIEPIRNELKPIQSDLQDVKQRLSVIARQHVNVDTTLDVMNSYLQKSGFQGFSLQKDATNEYSYNVIRQDGQVAHDLSEGEKNFIAYLYFHQMVRGSKEQDDSYKNRIVVIDDPATSMDSSVMYFIASMVHELMTVCLRNALTYGNLSDETFVSQLFVLTHNDAFFRLI